MHFNNVILLNIYYNLDTKSLFNCSLVNKHFNKLFDSDISWNKIIVDHYGNKYDDDIKQLSLVHPPKIIYRIICDVLVIGKIFNLITNSIVKLLQLTSLTSGYYPITRLPKEIRSFSNLQRLVMIHCCLREIPKEIGLLTDLIHVDLRGNNLYALPDEMTNLTKLRVLKLDNRCELSKGFQYEETDYDSKYYCECSHECFD